MDATSLSCLVLFVCGALAHNHCSNFSCITDFLVTPLSEPIAETTVGGNVTLVCQQTGNNCPGNTYWYMYSPTMIQIHPNPPLNHLTFDPIDGDTFNITISNLSLAEHNAVVICAAKTCNYCYTAYSPQGFVLKVNKPTPNTTTPTPTLTTTTTTPELCPTPTEVITTTPTEVTTTMITESPTPTESNTTTPTMGTTTTTSEGPTEETPGPPCNKTCNRCATGYSSTPTVTNVSPIAITSPVHCNAGGTLLYLSVGGVFGLLLGLLICLVCRFLGRCKSKKEVSPSPSPSPPHGHSHQTLEMVNGSENGLRALNGVVYPNVPEATESDRD